MACISNGRDNAPQVIWTLPLLCRTAVLTLVSGYLIANPLVSQGLGRPDLRWFRGWRPFSDRGNNVCSVRVALHRHAGDNENFRFFASHPAVTCPPRHDDSPCSVKVNEMFRGAWLQQNARDIAKLADQLCDAFLDDGAQRPPRLHITSRCGDANGEWKAATDPAVDACGENRRMLQSPERLIDLDQGPLVDTLESVKKTSPRGTGLILCMLVTVGLAWLGGAFAPVDDAIPDGPASWLSAAVYDVVTQRGSPLAVGLLRIATAAIVWARFGDEFLPMHRIHEIVNHESLDGTSIGGASPWGPKVSLALCTVTLVASFLMFIGLWSRTSTAATGGCLLVFFYGLGVSGGFNAFLHNHVNALVLVAALLPLTPCGDTFSVDAILKARRSVKDGGPAGDHKTDLWGTAPLRLLCATIYFGSAFNKFSKLGWVRGDRMEQIITMFYIGSSLSPQAPDSYTGGTALNYALFHGACSAMGVGTILLEILLGVSVYVRKIRMPMLLAGVILHGAMYITLSVYTFSATMWSLYLIVLDPEDVSNAVNIMVGGTAERSHEGIKDRHKPSWRTCRGSRFWMIFIMASTCALVVISNVVSPGVAVDHRLGHPSNVIEIEAVFENQGTSAIDSFWVHGGNERYTGTIAPDGGSWLSKSYHGHTFIFREKVVGEKEHSSTSSRKGKVVGRVTLGVHKGEKQRHVVVSGDGDEL